MYLRKSKLALAFVVAKADWPFPSLARWEQKSGKASTSLRKLPETNEVTGAISASLFSPGLLVT